MHQLLNAWGVLSFSFYKRFTTVSNFFDTLACFKQKKSYINEVTKWQTSFVKHLSIELDVSDHMKPSSGFLTHLFLLFMLKNYKKVS